MKNTVITGSSRGIGKAVAEEFAKNGYHVVINASKSADELEETRKEFVNKGYSCSAVLADVSDYGQCQRLFEAEPDVLINNAGISHIGLFTDMTPAEWKRLIDINLLSAFNCSHIALKSMIRNHRGRIINISSIWGERGASCEVVYSASKGGINSFMSMDLITASGCAKIGNLASNVASAVVFLLNGKVFWALVVPAALCNALGGYCGARYAIRGGSGKVRGMIFVVLGLMFAKMLWELLS